MRRPVVSERPMLTQRPAVGERPRGSIGFNGRQS
jgi:hypothetical protein